MSYIIDFKWLFSAHPMERSVNDPGEKLLNSMRTTARCRFHAAQRLKKKGDFSFFTTTILSLGLILIPLIQNAEIKLAYSDKVLNMMQIFLAVSILVYSTINSTARYDLRAQVLSECGDKLKELIRELRTELKQKNGTQLALEDYHKKYNYIVTDSENHERIDYDFCVLEMKDDYSITGLVRLKCYIVAYIRYCWDYIVPVSVILA
jgi:hypothetical protein